MNGLDGIGAGDVEVLKTALKLSAAEILRGETKLLYARPHRAVHDEDTFGQ